jgi:hypothetical protein
MNNVQLTNILMTAIFGLVAFVSKIFLTKMDRFDKKIERILMSDVALNKDVENIKEDIKDHEVRINKLEN